MIAQMVGCMASNYLHEVRGRSSKRQNGDAIVTLSAGERR